MQNTVMNLSEYSILHGKSKPDLVVGQVVEINHRGRAVVDFPGNLQKPLEARAIFSELPRELSDENSKIPVLLFFENGNPKLPIIIGFIREKFSPASSGEGMLFSTERPKEALVDGKRIEIAAQEEIIFHCGKSTITLKKSGKIVLKGTEIISRAARVNKIKGASVSIN